MSTLNRDQIALNLLPTLITTAGNDNTLVVDHAFEIADKYIEAVNRNKERPAVLGNDWISVADRLPHDGQQVLIHAEKIGTNSATYHEPCFGDNEKWLGWFSDEMPEPNVTHWQPLPSPPLKNDNHE